MSVEGKKDETMKSMVEDIRQEVTKTLQKVGHRLIKTDEFKLTSDQYLDTSKLDVNKMDKAKLIETIKLLNEQANVQRARVRVLADKIDSEYGGGQIAEIEGILEDISYYNEKIQKQKAKKTTLKSTIDSQNRLISKEETRKFLASKS